MKTNKQKALDVLKSIETKEQEAAQFINPTNYKQHNLGVADGIEGFGEVLSELANYPEDAKVNVIRSFEDKDYVFTHTEYNFFGPKVGFDVFRFEDGKIVEHWDNLRDTVTKPNPSGHTLTDGETRVRDIDKTERNEYLVEQFVKNILIDRKVDSIDSYFDGERYIQHNTLIGDGVTNLKELLVSRGRGNAKIMIYSQLHKILGEGNFILAISEGMLGEGDGEPTAFYDLLRIENDKIAEHWGIAQHIPDRSEWKNDNGKFGFA